ncbi:MAG: hypothetical protein PHI27_07275 [Eubacteriales bacterium]|nr:hypothetical protein [Eubacteriales bacterium]MDD3882037.1 hypothetical protein [Eubacteriales bacterium]MDD4512484.1 hypothetical protein [Eubacteriales bacterium]
MKRIRELIHWNISFSAFTEFREEIARTNLNSMKRISFVGMVGAALLSIASLPFINLLSMLKSYLVLTVLFSIVYVVSKTVLVKRADLVLPVYYAVITVMLTISILMGTVFGKDTNATTFILFIVTLPMFIVDKPYRVNILFAAASVIFCIADIHVKSGELLSLDISNSIVFYLLSLALSWQTIGIKVSDIIIKHELKQQRDMDMLTKLSNRSAFERVVAQYLHESN